MISEFFKSALSAVSSYLIQILLGIIVLLAIFAGVQTVRLRWCDKDLQIAQAKNETLSTKIATQSQAVRQWKEEGEKAKQQAEAAQQAAAKMRAENNRKIAKLQAEKVPVDCVEATQWAAGKAKELVEAW